MGPFWRSNRSVNGQTARQPNEVVLACRNHRGGAEHGPLPREQLLYR